MVSPIKSRFARARHRSDARYPAIFIGPATECILIARTPLFIDTLLYRRVRAYVAWNFLSHRCWKSGYRSLIEFNAAATGSWRWKVSTRSLSLSLEVWSTHAARHEKRNAEELENRWGEKRRPSRTLTHFFTRNSNRLSRERFLTLAIEHITR